VFGSLNVLCVDGLVNEIRLSHGGIDAVM